MAGHQWGDPLGTHLRGRKPRPVDALQLAPRHLTGRDDPCRRRDAEPDLWQRYALLMVPERLGQGQQAGVSTTVRLVCRRIRGCGEFNRDASDELHAFYKSADVRDRDDTDEIRKNIADFVRQVPKW